MSFFHFVSLFIDPKRHTRQPTVNQIKTITNSINKRQFGIQFDENITDRDSDIFK